MKQHARASRRTSSQSARALALLWAVAALTHPAGAARSEAATDEAERLPWVNPARCLAVCAADPEIPLRRVNDRAEIHLRGKFRMAAVAVLPLSDLFSAARAAGFQLRVSSAFRSYREQARLFRSIKERGRAARPGHSEHQLGTAIDLRLPTTAAIAWLAAHAHEFGFAVSYPSGKQRVTGYRPEPWHVRFVGPAVAAELHEKGWTLEEWFRAHTDRAQFGDCADCPAASSRTSCGRLTADGLCRGTVLSWCYDGVATAVDCAASQQTCAAHSDNGPPDCQ